MRPDGRSNKSTLRPLAAELSCLHRADGSAKFSSGQTSVLAAVYGPASATRECSNNSAVICVVFKHGNKQSQSSSYGASSSAAPGSGSGSGSSNSAGYFTKERELEHMFARSLSACILTSKYPRTVIEVVLQVLKADGSVVGVAFNAAVMALLDAGIAMNYVPIATTSLVSNLAVVTLDPTSEEETKKHLNHSSDNAASIVLLVTRTDPANHNNNKEHISGAVVASMTTPIPSTSRRTAASNTSNDQTNANAYTNNSNQLMSQQAYLACVEASFRASKAVLEFMRLAMEQKVNREAQTLFVNTGSQ